MPETTNTTSRPTVETHLTPKEIVGELDKYIVGQNDAKRAVAIALRNRWRRRRVPEELRDEISPKNIILIGSTGVGKTEIARRLAKLAQAPFVKVEASKFTEVGYVGRDVDSMIRDLVENSIQLVTQEEQQRVEKEARENAIERVLDLLLPPSDTDSPRPSYEIGGKEELHEKPAANTNSDSRERLRTMLDEGRLNERDVEVDAEEKRMPTMQIFSNSGMEEMGLNLQDMMGQMMGGNKRTRKRRIKIPEAIDLLSHEEAEKLVDQDYVIQEALRRAQDSGIIFLDEIDKIAKRGSGQGPDVSREGVQRDILPVVEGSSVTTKYGVVKTDHMLFIAAGAFHVASVSDLIPELQGRFPIRVELQSLLEADLLRIIKEPKNSLTVQYTALLETEQVDLQFTDDGLEEIARIAAQANNTAENIGARRLHTVFERLLDEVSFNAPDCHGATIKIDAVYVKQAMAQTLESEDLSRYIL